MALTDKLTAIANAIRAKTGGTATMTLAEMPTEIASIQTGITPSGSITLTSENTYDVTEKASAVVDFSATRANLAEAVTAKGVDTLPTSSFDTIATNIGLISGGGGLVKIGTVVTNPTEGTYGRLEIPANDGIYLCTNVSVTPNNSNRLPWAVLCHVDTTTPEQTAGYLGYAYGGGSITASASGQVGDIAYFNGASAVRFNTSATYDLYKLY